MKPPRSGERYTDFDREEVEATASYLRGSFELWTEAAEGDLRDPRLKPAKLPQLDARRNEIWRILFRIADLAGGRWPEAARAAALELSGGERRDDEASLGVKLLGDARGIRDNVGGEKITCHDLVDELNELDESPWGGWKDGAGLTTRLLGWKLRPFGIRAKTIRLDDGTTPKGYEWAQFEDAWSRYLPETGIKTDTTDTTGFQSEKTAEKEPTQTPSVAVLETPANPHEQRDVPVVSVSIPENGTGEVDQDEIERLADLARARRTPLPGDPDFLDFIAAVHRAGYITTGEALEREPVHRRVLASWEAF